MVRTWFKWIRGLGSGFVTVQFEDFDFSLPGFRFQDPDPIQVGSNLRFRIRNGHNSKFKILFLPLTSKFRIRVRFKWIRILNLDSKWYFFLSFRFYRRNQDYMRSRPYSRGFGPWIRIRERYLWFLKNSLSFLYQEVRITGISNLFQEDWDPGSGSVKGTYISKFFKTFWCTQGSGPKVVWVRFKRIRTADPDLWWYNSKLFNCLPRDPESGPGMGTDS